MLCDHLNNNYHSTWGTFKKYVCSIFPSFDPLPPLPLFALVCFRIPCPLLPPLSKKKLGTHAHAQAMDTHSHECTHTHTHTHIHNYVCTYTKHIQVCKAQTYTSSWEIALMQQKNESVLYTINKLTKVILILFTVRGWSHSKYMNFILPCLIYGSPYMLYQCIPCWRNIIDTSTTICEELSPTIVDIFHC